MIIFEKVQSMRQAQSPPTKIYKSKSLEANLWQKTLLSLINTIYFYINMTEIHINTSTWWHVINWEEEKGEQLGFLTRTSHKTGSTSITPTVFYHIGEGGSPSLIFVFHTAVTDKYDTVLLRNTKQRVETKYTQNAPAQFPAEGGCCFGFASKFLTELSASKCENRPLQKNWHTHIDLPYYYPIFWHPIPNWQICFVFLIWLKHISLSIVIHVSVFSINKSPQKKEPDGPDAKVTPCKRHRQASHMVMKLKPGKTVSSKNYSHNYFASLHFLLINLLPESKLCFTKFPVPLLSQKWRQKADFIVLLL